MKDVNKSVIVITIHLTFCTVPTSTTRIQSGSIIVFISNVTGNWKYSISVTISDILGVTKKFTIVRKVYTNCSSIKYANKLEDFRKSSNIFQIKIFDLFVIGRRQPNLYFW